MVVENFLVPDKMLFQGLELTTKEKRVAVDVLRNEFEVLLEDIDQYTDSYGKIRLYDEHDLAKRLSDVIGGKRWE
jgi:phosphoenolpyruvate-protein kinase (PTS system EI component)